MNLIFKYLPELQGQELFMIQELTKQFDDEKIRDFAMLYRSRRRDPNLILITALIGFAGFAGIHRFLINQIGMGILYLFTGGLCLIGTIVDLINYQSLAFEFNQKMAYEAAAMVRGGVNPGFPR